MDGPGDAAGGVTLSGSVSIKLDGTNTRLAVSLHGRQVPSDEEDSMRLVLTNAAWIGLAVSIGGVPLLAQLQDNSEKQMTCSNGGYDRQPRAAL